MTSNRITRRGLLGAAPAASLTIAVPNVALASLRDDERDQLIALIHELEAPQGWEASNVVAGKAWAAYQMRRVLGMDPPEDDERARRHCEFQRRSFEDYRRSTWFELDAAEGKAVVPPAEWRA